MSPTAEDLSALFRIKYGDPRTGGWGPRQRLQFGYYTPDDIYEATVAKLVGPDCAWIDVGCGRDLFPGNTALAKDLAGRCRLLFGVDDSENVFDNSLLHERSRNRIDYYRTDQTFDLATLRMVAEHITEPDAALASIARLMRPGGKVVVYTINQWSPISVISWIVPFQLHHWIKKLIWNSEERDTFPVAYKMNSRKRLKKLFAQAGFRESHFSYLDDCRATCRFRLLNFLELTVRKVLRTMGLRYPENCLLGIYEKL
jgi:SAM-dependent methyltransferase